MISIEVYMMRIGLHYSRHAKVKVIAHLNCFELLIVLSLLFIGGIERNPCLSSSSSDDSESFLSATEHIIEDKFSIVHYNGRTADDDIKIENFKLFRRDRVGDHHGGICVYIRNNVCFFSKRRHDLELPNIECLWVEISTKNKIDS